MGDGWISLHRELLDSEIFQHEGLLKLWIYCLLKASYKKHYLPAKTGRGSTIVLLKPGQLIFGRYEFAKKLRCKPATVAYWLRILEKREKVSIQASTHFSIVSIVNWDRYQNEEKKASSQVSDQLASNYQPTSTYNKVNKVNNKKRESAAAASNHKFKIPTGEELKTNGHGWIDSTAWDEFVQHRKDIKKPLTELAVKKALQLLSRFPAQQKEIVDSSIRSGWTGLFEPKRSSLIGAQVQNQPPPPPSSWTREKQAEEERRAYEKSEASKNSKPERKDNVEIFVPKQTRKEKQRVEFEARQKKTEVEMLEERKRQQALAQQLIEKHPASAQ